jgi:hypothetical protein
LDWLLHRAKLLIARGADPARAADQAAGGYVINKIEGWRSHHLMIVGASTGFCGLVVGAVAMVGYASLSGVRLASPHEAQVLEATANIDETILAMPRQELVNRLAVPKKAVQFADSILNMDASAAPVPPPDWLTRLGQRDRVGVIYSAAPTTRAAAANYVMDFLTGLPPEKRALALDQWAQFVKVGEDPQANKLLWQLANLSYDQRDAVLRAGFPPVPDNDEAREVYMKLAHANSPSVTACWLAMKRSDLNAQGN